MTAALHPGGHMTTPDDEDSEELCIRAAAAAVFHFHRLCDVMCGCEKQVSAFAWLQMKKAVSVVAKQFRDARHRT